MLKVRWIAPLTQDLHRSRKIKVSLLNTTEWNVYQIIDGNAKILKKNKTRAKNMCICNIQDIFWDDEENSDLSRNLK